MRVTDTVSTKSRIYRRRVCKADATHVKYTIEGIDCPNCAAKLAHLMEKIEGVDSAKINFLSEKLTVETGLDETALLAALRKTAKSFESGITIK
jgi:copper chaperone CopZ